MLRKVLWWALWSLCVDECAVCVIQVMYSSALSSVRVNVNIVGSLALGLVCIRPCFISPLLFILDLEAISHEFSTGVPWEFLYSLLTPSSSVSKLWKASMRSKGLYVKMKTTKFLVSGVGLDDLKKSSKYPWGVCCSGAGNNSIERSQCKQWVQIHRWSLTQTASSPGVIARVGPSTADQWLTWRSMAPSLIWRSLCAT